MSTPHIEATISNVVHEIGAASSSLHMVPCPIKDPHPEAFMLDELDEWAEHSARHLEAAVRSAVALEHELENLEQEIRWGRLTDSEEIRARLLTVLRR